MKFIFVILFFFISLLFSSVLVHGQTCPGVVPDTVNCTGFTEGRGELGLAGKQIVDQYGNPVQLRGISSHRLQYAPDCVTRSSIAYLVGTWGINVFRIAVFVDEWLDGYTVNSEFYDQFIEDVVYWCKDLGIYVIIDWHVIGDPNAHLDGWYQSTSGLAVDFFRGVAKKYRNETHVLYEIANEPDNVGWESLVWYHNLIISNIREFRPDSLIIIGTPEFSQQLDEVDTSMVERPYNILYAFHFNAATDEIFLDMFTQYRLRMPLFVSQWSMTDRDGEATFNRSVAEKYINLCVGTGFSISWVFWGLADIGTDVSSALEADSCR